MKSKIFFAALIAILTVGLKVAAQTSAGNSTAVHAVTFINNNLKMAGNLYLPAGFDKNKKHPAIVVVHPGGPRGQHPNAPNKLLFIGQSSAILFDGFGQADKLLTQPLLLIAGSEAGSLWHSQELHTKAASKEKELFIIKGATHMDLYDGKQYVPQVAKKLAVFFGKNL